MNKSYEQVEIVADNLLFLTGCPVDIILSSLPFGVTTAILSLIIMSKRRTKSMMYMSVKRTNVSLSLLSTADLLAVR